MICEAGELVGVKAVFLGFFSGGVVLQVKAVYEMLDVLLEFRKLKLHLRLIFHIV